MKRSYKIIIIAFCIILPLTVFLILYPFDKNIEEPIPEKNIEKDLVEEEHLDLDLDLDAVSALSVYTDNNKEEVLYSKNESKVLPIASITKIFTALIVWENYDLDAEIGVTEMDIAKNRELQNLKMWEDTSIKDALYPLLLESNNSVATALAMQDHRFLETDFIEKMNQRAKELQLTNTKFINPHGLDEFDNWNRSTVEDLYKATKYLLNNTDLFSIMNTPSYKIYSHDKTIYYTTINTNIFLFENNKYWKNKIVGGKTGWTFRAMGCLVLVTEHPQSGYIINVVLGAEDRFNDMEKLLDYIYEKI